VTTQPAEGKVEVTSVAYSSSEPPLRKSVGQISAGTVRHVYLVQAIRTKVNGSIQKEKWVFYVYANPDGGWVFTLDGVWADGELHLPGDVRFKR
jgi:hypothetical protein